MSNLNKKPKLENNVTLPFYAILGSEYIEDTPLTEVYVATIKDIKTISTIIVKLNAELPVPNLIHLKRIKAREILLFECSPEYTEEQIIDLLEKKNVGCIYLDTESIKKKLVAKIPPKTRKQYEIVNKLWPCNFHSNQYLEKLCNNSLFLPDEIEAHSCFMRIALDVAYLSVSDKYVGAVIVDPEINSVVGVGFDVRNLNPCQHAVMVAIDNVAVTQNGGYWTQAPGMFEDKNGLDTRGIPVEILNKCVDKYPSIKFGARMYKEKGELSSGPYLCTGYVAYVTSEPCVMCAMALVHSRISRVFYGVKSDNGALGTLCKVHVVKNLNHHYEVFAGLLEEECKGLN